MAARAPVEDVRTEAIGASVGGDGELQCLAEENDRLPDLRLRVANDPDEEHDLGSVDIGEPWRDGEACRFLEERHRLPELARPDSDPHFRAEQPERAGGGGCGAGALTRISQRCQRVVVVRRVDEALGLGERGVDPLHVRLADTVLEKLPVGVETAGDPLERL